MAEKPSDIICEGDVCRRVTPEEAEAHTASDTVPRIFKLLGESPLLGKGEAKVPLSSITGPNKVIALYFSAHWCPPCRQFTPNLADAYKKFKELHTRAADWEVVFVSSDRDQSSFEEYYAEMPWLALPYEKREAKAALSQLYKVRGIPTLVILDGETGALITANGRDALSDDPDCENFPWLPKTFQEIMEGAMLVDPPGENATVAATPVPALPRLAGKVTLLYFSAHWCPPCRRFTPDLVKTMKALRDAGKEVEAIFVSGDREEPSMNEYHGQMTWPALPFSDSKRRNELNQYFEVEGIPTLIVLDENFNIITTEGVAAVKRDQTGARFPWRPQPLQQLSEENIGRINNGPFLLLLVATVKGEEAAEAFAKQVLEPVAVATLGAEGGKDWTFVWAADGDDWASRVLDFIGGVKVEDENVAILVDMSKQASWNLGALGVQISEAGLTAAVADFKADKLGKGRPLGGSTDDDEDEDD